MADLRDGEQAGVKRWLEGRVYAKLPGGFRASAYFVYLYVLRVAFLDGKEGTAFHVLQGFWYCSLVVAKLREVRPCMRRNGVDGIRVIRDLLGIGVARSANPGEERIRHGTRDSQPSIPGIQFDIDGGNKAAPLAQGVPPRSRMAAVGTGP
jgi:hypothetical protein